MNKINLGVAALLVSMSAHSNIDTQQSVVDMTVTSDGIYRVTNTDILNLGIDLRGINLNKIAVKQNGIQVPVKIVSDNQATFGDNSYIEFVGLSANNLYQQGNVYTLLLSSNRDIQNSDLNPQENQQTVEYYLKTDIYGDNADYSFGSPIDDPWFAKRILAIGSEVIEPLDFEINNLVQSANVEIEMNIWGGTDYLQSPDHHVIYKLNGNVIDDFRFDGIVSDIRNYQIDSSSFNSGSQQLTVSVPNDTNTVADVIHIESWKISYPRAFVLENKQLDFTQSDTQVTRV
jgi:hypothetical protein